MRLNKVQSVALSAVIGIVVAMSILTLTSSASARTATVVSLDDPNALPSNKLVSRLATSFYRRPLSMPLTKSAIDEATNFAPQVREQYRQNALRSGADYYNAAIILGHSKSKEDILLGSELAIAALASGLKSAAPLAAWTHDRYLVSVGNKQRFGTLFTGDGKSRKPLPLDRSVTDIHRLAVGLPSMADAIKWKTVQRIPSRAPTEVAVPVKVVES